MYIYTYSEIYTMYIDVYIYGMFSSVMLPRGPPLSHHGPGPNGPTWALLGQALLGPLGPSGPGPYGPPWALMGQPLMGPPGPLWARPALMGPLGPCGTLWAGPLRARPL